MFDKVNEDIKRMKAIGKQAKDEADFAKLMQRQERITQALDAIGKIKADKNPPPQLFKKFHISI